MDYRHRIDARERQSGDAGGTRPLEGGKRDLQHTQNLGYNLEHNYGHGEKHLSTVFATLMMLAFLVDQMQEHVCALFKAARNTFYSRRALWEEMRALFRCFFIKSWAQLWLAIIFDEGGDEPQPDTG
jgi:hypothetical protein